VDFYELLDQVVDLLRNRGRVSYRALKRQFNLDDDYLADLKVEIIKVQQLAVDQDGEMLVWAGKTEGTTVSVLQLAQTAEPSPVQQDPSTPVESPPPEPPTLNAERRQLTVMFCDLADSTKLSGQLDPEDLREVIRAYQETAAGVIQRYAGNIAQYLGDGLLVYFGWPRAHEDDAQRSVHAGLGILEDMGDLNTRLEKEKGVQLAVRIGIHTGPVVIGEMGGGGRHENLATGETVNIAARLEGLAAPNTAVISQVTARLVQGAFELQDLGPQTLKGVAKPLQVFRVFDPMAIHDDETAAVGVPFLVGREEEVGLLRRRWEQSKEGLGQVVLLSGEAGIGKSSLLATVRTQVVDEGYTRIAFRCSPYYTNSALFPVITHLEHKFGFNRDDSPADKLDKLEQVLRTTSLSLDEVVPPLATLLSVPLDDRYPALALSPQQQRQQTLDTLVGWLLAEADRQPLLAVWEDLHWVDPSTQELLGLLLEQTPRVPMLSVLTFRPDFSPDWPAYSHLTPITLNHLERPQVEALIMHLAGDKTLPEGVVEHIVIKTDGIPMYVEELTKMFLESDHLREETDAYVLTRPLSTVSIPDTLQDSLMARLDQLSAAKEIAQLGAVLGREFTYEMLQAISPQDEKTVQAGLAQLVEAEMLYQRGRPPRARYIFKHALIQDSAYASLLRSTRQQMHQRIAQALEKQFSEMAEEQPELLAHHYTEAGYPSQAIPYWQRAGQRARQRSANREAIHHLTKGVELLAALPHTTDRSRQELDLLTTLGPALMVTGGYGAPKVEQVYTRARELCKQVGDLSRQFPILVGLARFYMNRGSLPTARDVGEQLLRLAQDMHETPLLSQSHSTLGSIMYFQGEVAPAQQHLEQSLSLYEPQTHPSRVLHYVSDPRVTSSCIMAMALWHLGYPDQALKRSHEALYLAQASSDLSSLAAGMYYVALLHQFRRETQATRERAEAAVRFCTEHGFALYLARGTIIRGWAVAAEGDKQEGIAQMRQGLASQHATSTGLGDPHRLALLAESYGNSGQAEEGLRILAEVSMTVGKTGEHRWDSELHRLKGELLVASEGKRRRDEHEDEGLIKAEACFHQALDITRQQQAKSLELRVAMSLARLWQSQDKRQDAYDLLAPVYGWFTEGFDTADLIDARALLEELV